MPVDSTHPDYDSWLKRWQRCLDTGDGQDAVKAAGETYLPRLSGHVGAEGEYDTYLDRSLYYNATGRTLDGLVGMVFRKPPIISVPPALDEFMDDFTGLGEDFETFAMRLVEGLLSPGRIGLLSDFSRKGEGESLSIAEARQLGLRPVSTLYLADDVTNWAVEEEGSVRRLRMAVVKECGTEPVDEFENKEVERYRVFSLDPDTGIYVQQTWEKIEDTQKWSMTDEHFPRIDSAPIKELPFTFVTPGTLGWVIVRPPLLDLANVNIAHYRNSADYEHGLLYTGNPQPYITGHDSDDEDTFRLGSSEAWIFPEEGVKVGFLEFRGQGLGALKEAMEDKGDFMAVLGSRMLSSQPKGTETAETARIHREGESSALARVARTAALSLEWSLRWMARWIGADENEISVELNTDYVADKMNAQQLVAMVGAWQGGALTMRDMFEALARGEVLRTGITFEAWKAEMEEEHGMESIKNAGTPPVPEKKAEVEEPAETEEEAEEGADG